MSKLTLLRKVCQASVLMTTVGFTLYASTAVCVFDPFWYIQHKFALLKVSSNPELGLRVIGVELPFHTFLLLFLLCFLLFGRMFCGWLCPFGACLTFVSWLSTLRREAPKELKDPGLKYVVLATFLSASALLGYATFCDFCPAGAVLKGLTWRPILLSAPVLVGVLGLTLLYGRKAWCSYLCPLGAVVALFARFHPIAIRSVGSCTKCLCCQQVCEFEVLVAEAYAAHGKRVRDPECVKCMRCVEACPRSILKFP